MYPIGYMSLYVFMKLTTRSTNVAFIGYYEFYSRLQTTVQFRLYSNLEPRHLAIYSPRRYAPRAVQGESKKPDTFDIQMNNKGVSFF